MKPNVSLHWEPAGWVSLTLMRCPSLGFRTMGRTLSPITLSASCTKSLFENQPSLRSILQMEIMEGLEHSPTKMQETHPVLLVSQSPWDSSFSPTGKLFSGPAENMSLYFWEKRGKMGSFLRPPAEKREMRIGIPTTIPNCDNNKNEITILC